MLKQKQLTYFTLLKDGQRKCLHTCDTGKVDKIGEIVNLITCAWYISRVSQGALIVMCSEAHWMHYLSTADILASACYFQSELIRPRIASQKLQSVDQLSSQHFTECFSPAASFTN